MRPNLLLFLLACSLLLYIVVKMIAYTDIHLCVAYSIIFMLAKGFVVKIEKRKSLTIPLWNHEQLQEKLKR